MAVWWCRWPSWPRRLILNNLFSFRSRLDPGMIWHRRRTGVKIPARTTCRPCDRSSAKSAWTPMKQSWTFGMCSWRSEKEVTYSKWPLTEQNSPSWKNQRVSNLSRWWRITSAWGHARRLASTLKSDGPGPSVAMWSGTLCLGLSFCAVGVAAGNQRKAFRWDDSSSILRSPSLIRKKS